MSILNSKIKIGSRVVPNRIVNQPMECNDADEAGNPTDLTFARYRKLAEGGAGIIFLEALTITRKSRGRKNQLEISEKTAPALEKLVREMKEINPDPLILLQIDHSGRQSNPSFSRVVSVYPTGDPQIHLLSAEELDEIGERFPETALIAKQVGADGIDFKQCHGYLCAELLRPANTRQDRFGGSFENRSRFFTETLQRIRKKVNCDSFIIGSRFSAYEGIPGGFGTSGPDEVIEDLTEPLQLARLMESLGLQYLNVSAGMGLTPEILRPTKKYPQAVYLHFRLTQAVKKAVGIPVIGSAYSYLRDGSNELKDPDPCRRSFIYWAEKNIREGICDLVGIGRQSLADPLFARKILEGKISEINYCRTCGGCSVLLRSQAQVGCSVYFDLYKQELQEIQKAAKE